MSRPRLSALLAALLLWLPAARADIEVAPRVLDPLTVAEAWNVIGLATRNVEKLLAEARPVEVTPQVSMCSPAIRTLVRLATIQESREKLDALAVRAFGFINNTAGGSLANDLPRTQAAYGGFRATLDEMAALFDPALVKAGIFICPDDPDVVSSEAALPCPKCRQRLLPRRIPYSFVYTESGEPTVKATAQADAPLTAGRESTVTLRLAQRDGTPITPRDLLQEHGHRIHLLLVDSALGDFQRVHPEPTETPGQYRGTFTPRSTMPYRMWVDVMPAATGLPESPQVELPSEGAATPILALDDTRASAAGGLTFHLTFSDRGGVLPRQREARLMRLTVKNADDSPATKLMPYMQAFAHLTGFYEDGSGIIRLHPEGTKILRTDVFGGPSLLFRLFTPRPGRIRFFCQVLVDGKLVVAPVDLSISP